MVCDLAYKVQQTLVILIHILSFKLQKKPPTFTGKRG